MKDLQVFDFNDSAVRTNIVNGTIWFALTDVCGVLGIKNPTTTVLNLHQNEKSYLHTTKVGNDNGSLRAINETGLYKLIFKSRKKEAIAFQNWVCEEVIPSIRKTGQYNIEQARLNQRIVDISKVKKMNNPDRMSVSMSEIGDYFGYKYKTVKNALKRYGFIDTMEAESDAGSTIDMPYWVADDVGTMAVIEFQLRKTSKMYVAVYVDWVEDNEETLKTIFELEKTIDDCESKIKKLEKSIAESED